MLSKIFFIFRVCLTFVKAVTLILKHATLLRTSNLPKAALTNVDLDYQRQNIDEYIQQCLTACASDISYEQFAGFIMSTEIGLFILHPFVTLISYCPFSGISLLSHYSVTLLVEAVSESSISLLLSYVLYTTKSQWLRS